VPFHGATGRAPRPSRSGPASRTSPARPPRSPASRRAPRASPRRGAARSEAAPAEAAAGVPAPRRPGRASRERRAPARATARPPNRRGRDGRGTRTAPSERRRGGGRLEERRLRLGGRRGRRRCRLPDLGDRSREGRNPGLGRRGRDGFFRSRLEEDVGQRRRLRRRWRSRDLPGRHALERAPGRRPVVRELERGDRPRGRRRRWCLVGRERSGGHRRRSGLGLQVELAEERRAARRARRGRPGGRREARRRFHGGTDPAPRALAHRGRHLLLEPRDDVVHVAVARLQAAVELQLLDGLHLVALGEIDLGELADRDEVLAVDPQGVRERPDRVLEPVELLVGLAERDVPRDGVRVHGESALERDDGVPVLPVPAVFLRQREKLSRRGVPLEEPLELLEAGQRLGRAAEECHGVGSDLQVYGIRESSGRPEAARIPEARVRESVDRQREGPAVGSAEGVRDGHREEVRARRRRRA